MQHFGPPLPTHTLDWLHYKVFRLLMLGPDPQAWFGLKACRGCKDIAFSVFAPTLGRDRVTQGTQFLGP